MGLLVDGKWVDKWYDTKKTGGRFERTTASFRNAIGSTAFPAQSNRYHLYVSHACPWAHRTLIFRRLKDLEAHISVSVVDPIMLENGWVFNKNNPDSLYHKSFLHQLYTLADPNYTGRVTVPVLWDKTKETIVCNESSEIIRMFNSAFNAITGNTLDFHPAHLRQEIDAINDTVYHAINNGVYKVGFSTSQAVYEEELYTLFAALETLETRLRQQRYLVGNQLTEADIRLFTTLIRFDPVYVGHFKCNIKRIIDFPNLWAYVRDIYHNDGIKETIFMDHIKTHYYASHLTINPTQIVPAGPVIDYDEPHGRDSLV